MPTLLSLPTFLLGRARLGLPNHVFGHVPAVASLINCLSMPNRTRPSKYLGCTWASPPPAQPAWARVWQDQVSPSPAHAKYWLVLQVKNRRHAFFAICNKNAKDIYRKKCMCIINMLFFKIYVFGGISWNFGFLTVFLKSLFEIWSIRNPKLWKSKTAVLKNLLRDAFVFLICNSLLNSIF